MTNRGKLIQYLGTLIFSTGTLIGFATLGIMIWGDLEASLLTSALDAEKSLTTLRCPIFLSPQESGQVTAKLQNPTDKNWERFTRAFISEGFVSLMREIKLAVPIPAGGKETVAWDVYPQDAAYDRVIFFRVYVNAKYPYPSLGGSCGIVMLDLWGLSGTQILMSVIAIFLGCGALGITLWKISIKKSDHRTWNRINSMYALALIIAIGFVISFMGAWLVALLVWVAALLLVGIIIGRRMSP